MKFIAMNTIILSLLMLGCAAHTNLTPTGEGNLSAELSIGGPVIEVFDTNIPAPYLTAGADYGLSERFDVNGELHLLSLAYKVFGLEAGVTWFPILGEGLTPTIGLSPRIMVLASLKSDVPERSKFYPSVSTSVAWKVYSGLIYFGGDFLLELSQQDYDDEASSSIFSPFLGYRWEIGEDLYLFTELKWQGSNIRSDQLVVEYVPIGGNGAISTLFAIQKRF